MECNRAKSYSRIKYSLSLVETAYVLFLLVFFSRTGWAGILAREVTGLVGNRFLALAGYMLAVYGLYYFLSFPLTFYQSFLLERRFSLSTQRLGGWVADQLKAGCVVYGISLLLLSAFYWAVGRFPHGWWLVISMVWAGANLLLARLAPIIILPLFFKYKDLTDEGLKARIMGLAEKMRLRVADVFEIDMSKKTVKANAGLLGWGASRRVVLGDTLKDKYTPDEIEVILAHEFSHQKLGHLPKLMALNCLIAFCCFYLIYATSPLLLSLFRLSAINELAGLPLVIMYFLLFGLVTQPLFNFLSRRMERNADLMALKATGLRDSFISTMEKLGQQNLSDCDPHPLIKFFFFDHPPINERIASAYEAFQS